MLVSDYDDPARTVSSDQLSRTRLPNGGTHTYPLRRPGLLAGVAHRYAARFAWDRRGGRQQHGAESTTLFGEDFFSGGEYRQMSAFNEATRSLLQAGAIVRRGNRGAGAMT